MYAIGMINLGNGGMRIPCGNDGMQRLHNKTMRGWTTELKYFRRRVDEVWVVNDFTQEMCEMNNGKLVDYVFCHGKRIF